jgi:hypothetical protein
MAEDKNKIRIVHIFMNNPYFIDIKTFRLAFSEIKILIISKYCYVIRLMDGLHGLLQKYIQIGDPFLFYI